MQEPTDYSGVYYANSQLQKMKNLQKLKNSLITTLAQYVANTATKTVILDNLNQIKGATCNVVAKTVNGVVIPGSVLPNSKCDC
jgi:recombinational DNA repair protein RecR